MAFKMKSFSGFKNVEPKTRKNIFGTKTTVTIDPETGKKTKTKVKRSGKTKVVEKVDGKRKVTKTYASDALGRESKVKGGGKVTKTRTVGTHFSPKVKETTRRKQVGKAIKGAIKTGLVGGALFNPAGAATTATLLGAGTITAGLSDIMNRGEGKYSGNVKKHLKNNKGTVNKKKHYKK